MSPSSPPIIGLAGGVGAGKSTVAEIFASLGCIVCNSDQLGRQALEDPTIKSQLIKWWTDSILDDQGKINRSAVATIVFTDPQALRMLESLTHPWIEHKRHEQFADAPPTTPALIIDAPLLYESGLHATCDAVIFIDTPPEVRLTRVQTNRHWDENEWKRRESAQMPLDTKRKMADHVIHNHGEPGELTAQARRILDLIIGPPG